MKAYNTCRLYMLLSGRSVEIYFGDYQTARQRFDARRDKLPSGWAMRLTDKRGNLILSTEKEVRINGKT